MKNEINNSSKKRKHNEKDPSSVIIDAYFDLEIPAKKKKVIKEKMINSCDNVSCKARKSKKKSKKRKSYQKKKKQKTSIDYSDNNIMSDLLDIFNESGNEHIIEESQINDKEGNQILHSSYEKDTHKRQHFCSRDKKIEKEFENETFLSNDKRTVNEIDKNVDAIYFSKVDESSNKNEYFDIDLYLDNLYIQRQEEEHVKKNEMAFNEERDPAANHHSAIDCSGEQRIDGNYKRGISTLDSRDNDILPRVDIKKENYVEKKYEERITTVENVNANKKQIKKYKYGTFIRRKKIITDCAENSLRIKGNDMKISGHYSSDDNSIQPKIVENHTEERKPTENGEGKYFFQHKYVYFIVYKI